MKGIEEPRPQEEEDIRAEKEAKLDTIRHEFDGWHDRLGKHIDSDIKETIAVCNVMGVPTSASCEGHLERGFPVPWVDIEAPNKPKWRFENEQEIYEQVATKYSCTVDQVRHADNDEAWIEAMRLRAEQEETAEYIEWKEECQKLLEKMEELLSEFYEDRNVQEEIHIITEKGPGMFRIHNGGKFYIPSSRKERLQNELTEEERNNIPEVLRTSQQEMRAFTEFLKEKYFA